MQCRCGYRKLQDLWGYFDANVTEATELQSTLIVPSTVLWQLAVAKVVLHYLRPTEPVRRNQDVLYIACLLQPTMIRYQAPYVFIILWATNPHDCFSSFHAQVYQVKNIYNIKHLLTAKPAYHRTENYSDMVSIYMQKVELNHGYTICG